MKKVIALFLVVVTLCSTTAILANAASYSTGSYTVTANSGVNVRCGAGTNYSKVGAAANGTTFTVTKVSGSWGYTSSIRCTNGVKAGWISLNNCKYNSTRRSSYNDVFASVKGSGYSLSQARSVQSREFKKGTFVYVWAYVHDINNNLYKSYGTGTCNMTLSIYRPNGSCAYTYTYKNCDNNWIGCRLDQAGTWKIQSKITGSLSGTNTQTITVKEANPVKTTTKTVTINANTIEEWSEKIKEAEMSVRGFGRLVGNVNGTWIESDIITGREVLSYKKIKVTVHEYGPPTAKSGKTVYVKVPYKIRYTIHRHEYGTKSNTQYWGNFMVGFVNMKIVHTQQCSCGKAYTCTWEMPDLTINKVTAGETYMVKSRIVSK